MNTIILTIIVACLIFIAFSLTSIANTLWGILQELSVEQKAQRYDKALEKSKRLYKQGTTRVAFLEDPTWNVWENVWPVDHCTFNALTPDMGINGLFLASVYSPKYTNAAEHPIDHLHSVLCDFDFNIVFDPQPEYAKVVNYPYSKLIGYNGIRSIDIIKKIE